jgi:hypothetical protein
MRDPDNLSVASRADGRGDQGCARGGNDEMQTGNSQPGCLAAMYTCTPGIRVPVHHGSRSM